MYIGFTLSHFICDEIETSPERRLTLEEKIQKIQHLKNDNSVSGEIRSIFPIFKCPFHCSNKVSMP